MKIGFVVEYFPSTEEMSGGVRVSVMKQVRFLSREHEVVVLAPHKIFPGLARYTEERKAQGDRGDFRRVEQGIRVYRPLFLHFPVIWKFLEPLQLLIWIALVFSIFERGISVIHAHRCFPVGYAASLAVLLLRCPFVLTAHGSDVNFGLSRKAVGRWVSFCTKYALKHASKVIAVSRALGRKMQSAGIEERKIRVIPNGADASPTRPVSKKDARTKLGLPLKARMVLLASNLIPVKDPLTLVRAFAILKVSTRDAILVILGRGELEERLHREVAALCVSDSVFFKGMRSHQEVPLWLGASDVVALSSLDEGCPVIALEALMAGRPFVGTAVGGVPEVVSDENIGLLAEVANPAALATALEEALGKQWSTEKLVEHGMKYSWDNIGRQIAAVYVAISS